MLAPHDGDVRACRQPDGYARDECAAVATGCRTIRRKAYNYYAGYTYDEYCYAYNEYNNYYAAHDNC